MVGGGCMEVIKNNIDTVYICLVYFFPGYISAYIFDFFDFQRSEINKNLFIRSLFLSTMYIFFLKQFNDRKISEWNMNEYFIVFCIAIIFPYLCFLIKRIDGIDKCLKYMGVKTSLARNAMDYIKRTRKKESMTARVYLDNVNIMYSGKIAYDIYDVNIQYENNICLVKYKKYYRKDNEYIELLQEECDMDGKILLLNLKDIARIEFAAEKMKK